MSGQIPLDVDPSREALTVAGLMLGMFPPTRPPRSDAYKAGCESQLIARLEGRIVTCIYDQGTAEFDAWFAGAEEGRALELPRLNIKRKII